MNDLTVNKTKIQMLHPYAMKKVGRDLTKKIEVEVHGEYRNGVPNGLCWMYYQYKGELGDAAYPVVNKSDPYLDGQRLTFKGIGMFVEGVLSQAPAFFVDGEGYSLSFSWMKDGRPSNNSQYREYYPEGKKIPVYNSKTSTDVSNCLYSIGTVDSNRDKQGYAKAFYDNGNV